MIKNSIIYWFLYLLPKNALSSLVGYLVSLENPLWLIKKSVKIFARIFKINIQEAEKPIDEYKNIQEFFARKLKPQARCVIYGDSILASPCDGVISQMGKIEGSTLIQAKGRNYSLLDLVKKKDVEKLFLNGYYCTIYLSPKDYHRFHMPVVGDIYRTSYYPGFLWPVNRFSVNNVDKLFCQNERVLSLVRMKSSNKTLGIMFVAATMVGKIKLTYSDISQKRDNQEKDEQSADISLKQGDELGKFMFGSTIILLFEAGSITDFYKKPLDYVKMGEKLAILTH